MYIDDCIVHVISRKSVVKNTAICDTNNKPFMNYYQGAVSIRKTVLPGMAIPMLNFNMEIATRR